MKRIAGACRFRPLPARLLPPLVALYFSPEFSPAGTAGETLNSEGATCRRAQAQGRVWLLRFAFPRQPRKRPQPGNIASLLIWLAVFQDVEYFRRYHARDQLQRLVTGEPLSHEAIQGNARLRRGIIAELVIDDLQQSATQLRTLRLFHHAMRPLPPNNRVQPPRPRLDVLVGTDGWGPRAAATLWFGVPLKLTQAPIRCPASQKLADLPDPSMGSRLPSRMLTTAPGYGKP